MQSIAFGFKTNKTPPHGYSQLHLRQKMGNSGNLLTNFSRGSQIIISDTAEHGMLTSAPLAIRSSPPVSSKLITLIRLI